jgi:hypothetical protein
MPNLLRRRPSAAMIVAVLALTLSIVGTSFAAMALNHRQKHQVRKIANKRISKRAGALTVATAGFAQNVIAASVPGGCTKVNGGTGGVSVAPASGECNVTFANAIQTCAIVLGASRDAPGGGEVTYHRLTPNVVQVSRRDSNGGNATAGAFSIVAVCPG